jgi:hypothetical protein
MGHSATINRYSAESAAVMVAAMHGSNIAANLEEADIHVRQLIAALARAEQARRDMTGRTDAPLIRGGNMDRPPSGDECSDDLRRVMDRRGDVLDAIAQWLRDAWG